MKKVRYKILSIALILSIATVRAQSVPEIEFQFQSKTGKYWNGCGCENPKINLVGTARPNIFGKLWVIPALFDYDKIEIGVTDTTGQFMDFDGTFTNAELISEMGPNSYIQFRHFWNCKKTAYRQILVIRGWKIVSYDKKVNNEGIIIKIPNYGKPHIIAQSKPFLVSAKGDPLPAHLISDVEMIPSGQSVTSGGGNPVKRKNDLVLNEAEKHNDGVFTDKNETGATVRSGEYKNNKPVGTWKWFDASGSVYKEIVYSADGSFKETNYLSNGGGKKVSVINCNSTGERNGLMQTFDKNGNVEDETTYLNGKKTGPHKTFRNSKLEKSGQYIDGQQDGLWKLYDTNGDIEFENTYSKGTKSGPCKTYYKGKLSTAGQFKDGKKDGAWKTYDLETGKVKKTENYKDGEPVQ